MINSSTEILYEILEKGKKSASISGIGCTGKGVERNVPTSIWIPSRKTMINTQPDSNDQGEPIMKGTRSTDNCYLWTSHRSMSCKVDDEVDIWHKKLGHTNYRNIQQLISKEAVRGLPQMSIKEKTCGECQVGKQTKVSHQMLQQVVTTRILELLHMDLMVPMQVESIGGKKYIYVCVDDYSRYTFVEILREKSDAFEVFQQLATQLQREKGLTIIRIRKFCNAEGIRHEFSAPITQQQNRIVERKNRTIQEMARVTLHAKKIPVRFWAEAVNTACYIHNRITFQLGTNNTTYGIWRGRKPSVQYFHIFGSVCYILFDREQRQKFDIKEDEWIFIGYSRNS
ncbi:hypothetical protein LIER_38985 [Lithospermum erythrorhizon]|uniref:Integrase catalytic domain-containing protein n=1 Tax=Lithospermum erythrorhizon TaxID=34254 RepID=A0AAV3Q877_LITER